MATKPKPKGWSSLSKAQQDAWKKANFNKSVKVTEAQLDKLRKEGTPTKAIAKYKNDPAMREALNRFYGKKKVDGIAGTGSTTGGDKSKLPPGKGPGYTRTKGPGPNYIGAGNVANYKTKKLPNDPRGGGNLTGSRGKEGLGTRKVSMDQYYRGQQKGKRDAALIVGGIIPGVGLAGKVAPKIISGASKAKPKVVAKGQAVASKVKSMTSKKVTTQADPKVVTTAKKTTTMKTASSPKTAAATKKTVVAKATKATATKAPAKTTAKKTTTPKKGSQ
jgi:hypothetical protein